MPAGAWLMCALALAAGMFTVISLVSLLISGELADWAGLVRQVGALVGAGLFAATAVSYRRRGRGEAGPVSGLVRWIGYLGVAAFVPYVVLKSWWALGFGAGPELSEGLYGLLASYGVDATAVAAVVGMVLLLALVRPWGERLPRWWVALVGVLGFAGFGVALAVTAVSYQRRTRRSCRTH
ncbi:hypothetical protein HNR67_005500 [Crossiella cryophila]|uniref:Uncharacterized protein n=1 Tax=Crossiella cryophila TaxID=43355 RepID=A0A7W7CE82_9PSEU|nr:hypothetical protein [Crossiella cryophila]